MDISEQLFERAKKVLPGGVNSPVRAYRAVGMAPRFITRADGAYIYNEDGKKYIDYVCSWGPMILGHNHPVIREAVEKAVKDGHPAEIEVLLDDACAVENVTRYANRQGYTVTSVPEGPDTRLTLKK